MYKRKPRIVFIAEFPEIPLLAQRLAEQLGSEWIESKATALHRDEINWWLASLNYFATPINLTICSEELLDWADLLVSLDEKTNQDPPSLPNTTRLKHWPIQDNAPLAEQLRQRISGMLGGIHMLHKV